MLLEVVKAFSLEHNRWLSPLQEHALREVKGAAVEGRKAEPEARRIYDPLTEELREQNCWTHIGTIDFDRTEKPFVLGVKGMTQSKTFRYWLVVTEILLALYRSAELGRTARFGREELGHRVPLMACSS